MEEEREEKWVTLSYGDGASFKCPVSAIPKMQETVAMLRDAARKSRFYTVEEADKLFTLTIVVDEDK